MKVFKFGGASIKDADAVRNLIGIIEDYIGYELVIVVSAMGKTTNALERLSNEFLQRDGDINLLLEPVRNHHLEICDDLFPNRQHKVYKELDLIFDRIKERGLELKRSHATYDFFYDQIVSEGEMISSTIINEYLNEVGIYSILLNARKIIKTDDQYRNALVDWESTEKNFKNSVSFQDNTVYLIQGFVGYQSDGRYTTLGREGSDFSAAIAANCLNAKEVFIWKDVPGLLNADPKYFQNTKLLKNISYHEAVELAYYGASIIHPKTIKPLQNKGIPLMVKSFRDKALPGSIIDENSDEDSLIPSYIFKTNQVLYSIFTRDYSFVTEQVLSELFNTFSELHLKTNLVEFSAISFTACFDYDEAKVEQLTNKLGKDFKVLYNRGVELMTVRHYDQATLKQLSINKEILVDQRSRHTARIVMKDQNS